MPRRVLRSVPIVVVPGWNGSGPGHWQSWLEQELSSTGRDLRRPPFGGIPNSRARSADVDKPDLAEWLAALRFCLADLPADGYDVVAHSLGSVLWLHHVADPGDSPRAARVLLVAPPSPGTADPEIADFFPPPMDVDTVRRGADGTVLVAGGDDPFLPEGIAEAYGRPLKMATTIVEGGGHLNTESGFGAWPAVVDWCNRDNLAFY